MAVSMVLSVFAELGSAKSEHQNHVFGRNPVFGLTYH